MLMSNTIRKFEVLEKQNYSTKQTRFLGLIS